jgi:hypothetical protein
MADWGTPNTAWVSTDVVATTDLNRIEENTQYLYDRFTLAGGTGINSTLSVPGTSAVDIAWFGVRMVTGNKLILHTAKFYIVSSALSLRVTSASAGGFTSTTLWDSAPSGPTAYSGADDVSPDHDLGRNTTGSDITIQVKVQAYNPTGGAINVLTATAFSLTLGQKAV